MIALQDVGVSYRRKGYLGFHGSRFWALQSISFDVRAGETLAIIGRNGAGKSTLLRLLAGIIRPDRGTLWQADVRCGLLSLQVGFLPHLTGRENAILSGILLGMTARDVQKRMDAIVDFAELHDFIDEPVATYSAGMRARLGFAVAFQVDPDVLLIDEVLGVGDADFVEKSSAALRQRLRAGKTAVLVTHQAPTARELCPRAVWIENGRTQAIGPTAQVLPAYEQFLRERHVKHIRALRGDT